MGIGSNGPAYGEGPLMWQIAYPYLTLVADRICGRRDLLEREWAGIERFGDYLLAFDAAELAPHCLGDHGSLIAQGFSGGSPDKEFVGWCAILWALGLVCEAGERLGCDVERFATAASELRPRIIDRFKHENGSFGDGTQTSWAFAAELGLGDQSELVGALVRAIKAEGGVLTTGIFGTSLGCLRSMATASFLSAGCCARTTRAYSECSPTATGRLSRCSTILWPRATMPCSRATTSGSTRVWVAF